MPEKYRILILEDMAEDAELIMDELKRSGLNTTNKWVEIENELCEICMLI